MSFDPLIDAHRRQTATMPPSVFHAMNRALAAAPIAAVLLVLAGCASGRPPGCGEPGGYESTVCQQYDYLIQVYRPGSRPRGWCVRFLLPPLEPAKTQQAFV
jgi:hypothetical protein